LTVCRALALRVACLAVLWWLAGTLQTVGCRWIMPTTSHPLCAPTLGLRAWWFVLGAYTLAGLGAFMVLAASAGRSATTRYMRQQQTEKTE